MGLKESITICILIYDSKLDWNDILQRNFIILAGVIFQELNKPGFEHPYR